MRRMRMRALSMLLALLFMLPLHTCAEGLRMDVYVYDPCGGCGAPGAGCKSCSIIDEIANRYRLMFADESPEIVFHNLRADQADQAACDERLLACGIDPDTVALPLLWIGDAVFQADGSVDEAIRTYVEGGCADYPGMAELLREKAEYEARAVTGTVVYLYSPYCEDCRDISRWLRFSLPLGYELVTYDIYTEAGQEMEKYLLDDLGIPVDEYKIPLVVYGTYWFAGKDSIYLSLKSRIQEHPGLSTTQLVEQ